MITGKKPRKPIPPSITKRFLGSGAAHMGQTAILSPFLLFFGGFFSRLAHRRFYAWKTRFMQQPVSLVQSRIGPGLNGDLVHSLANTPVRRFLYIGTAGTLDSAVAIGDIVVAEKAIVGEGFSAYFLPGQEEIPARTTDVRLALELLAGYFPDRGVHSGSVYSVASLIAEDRELVDSLQKRQVTAIDMETSALYTAAKTIGIRALSIQLITDRPPDKSALLDKFPLLGLCRLIRFMTRSAHLFA